jgi:hypothetical protein
MLGKSADILPLLGTSFAPNRQELIKHNGKMYLFLAQTGFIYQMSDPQGDSVVFSRIDNTININYNISCTNFIYKDQIYNYGGYGFYFGEGDKATALERLKQTKPDATEADLVLLKQDKPGNISGDFTPEQLKKAQDIVGNEFDARFGREVDYALYRGGGGGLTANQQAEAAKQREDDLSLWRLTYDSFNNVTNTNDMATKLTTASGGKFIFKARKDGGYDVKDESGHVVAGYGKKGDSDYSAPVKNPRDIWRLFERNDTYWNQIYRESGLEDYNKRVKQFGSKPSSSGGAGTLLNRLTGGSTVDYGSK